MIAVTCTGCGQKLQVPESFAGKKGKCPYCRLVLSIAPLVPVLDTDVRMHGDILAPPEGPDEIGRLGPYRVLKVLGTGGMGVVFLAEDLKVKQQVALKTMRAETAANERARKRFLREARATAALQHDHIATVYHVGEDRGVPFLAMQVLQGEALHDRLQREEQLPVAEVLRIGRETAEGLAAAHERGLIHRDIKPANLWLEGEPGASATGARVKIVDFGLARVAGDDQRLTQTGMIVGTPEYMAPEQARGETIDARCDLFSLGCVLYHLCTGRQPFQGKDTMSTLLALSRENPMPACLVNLEVSPALSDLIEKLLAKKPEDRPASAQAVVESIKAIENGDVSGGTERLARSGAGTSDSGTISRRRRAVLLLVGAGVLAASAVIALLFVLGPWR
jgi:serine/threonine protein kinase